MRLLHLADIHLGKGMRGQSRQPEFEAVLEEIEGIAIAEAVDCVLVNRDGAFDWDAAARGYVVYAQVAREHGLKPGRDFGDAPHVQMYQHEPHHQNTAADIDGLLAATDPKFAALA